MTFLRSLSIEHFRGFYDSQTIEFAIPSGPPSSGLTVIVGPNNSGKTTILEALKKIVKNNPQFDKDERHPGHNVCITTTNTDSEKKVLKTSGGSVAINDNPTLYPKGSDVYVISSRRYFETYFGTHGITHDKHMNILLDIGKSGSDSSFGQRMIEVERIPEQKEKFNNIIKRFIPTFSEWNIELSRNQNYIRYITGNSNEHSSELFGDGVTSLFKIAIDLVDNVTSEILVIDEPELSLHPQSQKELAKLLSEHSCNRQIILTTHSPFFIRWEDIANGAKVARIDKPDDKGAEVKFLKEATILDLLRLTDDWQKPHLLDTTAKEIFFSNGIVFVEGQEDMGLLSKFIKDENIEINFEIFGYGSGGAGNVKNFLAMTKDLKIFAGALFDNNSKEKTECETNFPDNCILSIITDDIRDKPSKSIIGIFDEHGVIKPEQVGGLRTIIDTFKTHFEKT